VRLFDGRASNPFIEIFWLTLCIAEDITLPVSEWDQALRDEMRQKHPWGLWATIKCYGHRLCRLLAQSRISERTVENADSNSLSATIIVLSRAYPEWKFDTESGRPELRDSSAGTTPSGWSRWDRFRCDTSRVSQDPNEDYQSAVDRAKQGLIQTLRSDPFATRLPDLYDKKYAGIKYGGNGKPWGAD
jgi:hypothetical protein